MSLLNLFPFYGSSSVVNVQDYGASPNGTTVNDAAVANALASIPPSGGVLYFPNTINGATYVLSGVDAGGPLRIIRSNIVIKLDPGVTLRLKPLLVANQGALIQLADYSNGTVRGTVKRVGVFCPGGLATIDGNKANQKNGSGAGDSVNTGIVIEDAVGIYLENLEVRNCDGYGIGVVGSGLPHRGNLIAKNLRLHGNNYDGMDFKFNFRNAKLERCWSYNNGFGGNIPGRDGVGFDVRGEDIELSDCVTGLNPEDYSAAPNNSGGFRERPNAGRGIVFRNCNSFNAAPGTNGFSLQGSNLDAATLIACESVRDDVGYNPTRGHHTMIGCKSRDAVTEGIRLEQEAENTITTTTASVTIATGSQVISVVEAITLPTFNIVRITDGTNWVQGRITAVNTIAPQTITVDVKDTNGSGSIASGANVVTLTIGKLSIIGGSFNFSGQDGLRASATTMPLEIIGASFDFNGRYGVNCDNNEFRMKGGTAKNNGQTNASKIGILIQNQSRTAVLEDVDVGDNQTVATQASGVGFSGTNSGTIFIDRVDFTGVTGTAISGNYPALVRIKDCIPFLTSNTTPIPTEPVKIIARGRSLTTTGATLFSPPLTVNGGRIRFLRVWGRISAAAGTKSTDATISVGSAASYTNVVPSHTLSVGASLDNWFEVPIPTHNWLSTSSAQFGVRVLTAATGTGLTMNCDIMAEVEFAPA